MERAPDLLLSKPLRYCGLILAVVIGLSPHQAFAAARAAASTAGVSLAVEATCLVKAAPLVFGPYKGRARMSIGTIWITCTKTTPYIVGLDAGAGGSVTYSLFSDPAHVTNWGQTVGADTTLGIGDGGAQALNIYGQVMNDGSVASDNYIDTITVTITY